MTLQKRTDALRGELYAIALLGITLLIGIGLSKDIVVLARDGLLLAVGTVVPASLPFMVVSDLYVCYGRPENIRGLKWAFTSLFGFSQGCLAPFICGNVGGFPIGAKMSAERYSAGLISRDEAERLLPLANNPSIAFVIGGVGLGIYRDVTVGVLLLISIYSATVLCGVLTRSNANNIDFSGINIGQNYNFINSVKNAGSSSIGIISFISIFSVLNGLVGKYIKYKPILYIVSTLLEVTNAVKIHASLSSFPPSFSLMMSAFSLGFGGICVGMQSAAFATRAGLKMRKYYLIKLLLGSLSACIFSILFILIK